MVRFVAAVFSLEGSFLGYEDMTTQWQVCLCRGSSSSQPLDLSARSTTCSILPSLWHIIRQSLHIVSWL